MTNTNAAGRNSVNDDSVNTSVDSSDSIADLMNSEMNGAKDDGEPMAQPKATSSARGHRDSLDSACISPSGSLKSLAAAAEAGNPSTSWRAPT